MKYYLALLCLVCALDGFTQSLKNIEIVPFITASKNMLINSHPMMRNWNLPTGSSLRVSFAAAKISNRTVTSINSTQGRIQIFPNPSDGTINFSSPIDGNITITDLNGKTVFQTDNLFRKEQLNIAHLENGFYQLQISTSTETHFCKIIISK